MIQFQMNPGQEHLCQSFLLLGGKSVSGLGLGDRIGGYPGGDADESLGFILFNSGHTVLIDKAEDLLKIFLGRLQLVSPPLMAEGFGVFSLTSRFVFA